MHTICFGQKFFGTKTGKTSKNKKIVVSAEIAQNQKRHLFFEKGVSDMGEKVGFTNCVFEKLCSSENTMFIEFSAKHSNCNKKLYVEQKRKFTQNSGLFFYMAKRCFVYFSGFNFSVVCFCVFGKVAKALNMLVVFLFPILGVFCGVA